MVITEYSGTPIKPLVYATHSWASGAYIFSVADPDSAIYSMPCGSTYAPGFALTILVPNGSKLAGIWALCIWFPFINIERP